MKKFLSLFLTIVMLALCIPFSVGTATLPAAADTLPAAVDLSTSSHLPKIGNQGGVGCCVSMAATYMQLSNAYSRYLHDQFPSITWNPSSGDGRYVFAPRFTYNLGGANTAPVYHILQEQGAPLQTLTINNQSYSMSFSGGVTGYAYDNELAKNWGTADGVWDAAQQYRIKDFDQVWAIVTNAPEGTSDANRYKYQTFNNQAGIEGTEYSTLIDRIKASLNAGNVVVTGGYPDRWVTDLVTISNKGTYGKTGDKAIPYSTNVSSGGHQVSIVGYDDNITCVKNGVTLRGAFKVANSWGSWQNSGFIWMMYDSLNGYNQSSYSALNVEKRIWTMDQFVFLDWHDMEYGTPDLMAKVTVNSADRDNFTVTLKKMDPVTGEIESYVPYMYSERCRADWAHYDNDRGRYVYYNFSGQENSNNAVNGVLTFNFDHFTEDLPEGKTINDYLWGVEVSYYKTESGKTATVKKVELLRNGVSVYNKSGLTDTVTAGTNRFYMLDSCLAVSFDLPKGVSVVPISDTVVGPAGSTFEFSVDTISGYSARNYLNVYHNGTRVVPVDGVYSIVIADGESYGGNVIKVSGVQPNSVGGFTIQPYGENFEKPEGPYWLVFTVNKSSLDPDAVDMSAISAGSYKYTIRFTLTNGEIYDFKPQSYYDWGNSLLYRVNVADQGWFPTSGTTYTATVEFCRSGIPIFRTSSQYVFSCNLAPFSNSMTSHTHVYDGEQFAVTTSSCFVSGSGYTFCSHPGCRALKQTTLAKDSTAHTFGNTLTVSKNATKDEPGEFSCACRLCGVTAFAGYFWAPKCDTTGDNRITMQDVTLLLNYLAQRVDESAVACDADFTGDGVCTVKDLTYLLLVLAGKIEP